MKRLLALLLAISASACFTVEMPSPPTPNTSSQQDAGTVATSEDGATEPDPTPATEDGSVVGTGTSELSSECQSKGKSEIIGFSSTCMALTPPQHLCDECAPNAYACDDPITAQPPGLHCYGLGEKVGIVCCGERQCVRHSAFDGRCGNGRAAFSCFPDMPLPDGCTKISDATFPAYCCPQQ